MNCYIMVPAFKKPKARPLPPNMKFFNKQLAKVHVKVEHTLGINKACWQVLKMMCTVLRKKADMQRIINIITCCFILSNIMIRHDAGAFYEQGARLAALAALEDVDRDMDSDDEDSGGNDGNGRHPGDYVEDGDPHNHESDEEEVPEEEPDDDSAPASGHALHDYHFDRILCHHGCDPSGMQTVYV